MIAPTMDVLVCHTERAETLALAYASMVETDRYRLPSYADRTGHSKPPFITNPQGCLNRHDRLVAQRLEELTNR